MTLNWRDLNKKLPSLSEAEVQHLLLDELNSLHGMHRGTVVVRLHQRFTALRATRERDELLAALRDAQELRRQHDEFIAVLPELRQTKPSP
jgi:hypothetical protein